MKFTEQTQGCYPLGQPIWEADQLLF